MRPRFMNRGSDTAADTTAAERPGFNEAPIHESGKSGELDPLGGVELALQ